MWSGTHWISRPRATRASRRSASRPPLRMYHCRVVTISSGRSPFSKNFTGWVIGFGSPSQVTGLAQQLHDALLGAEHGLAGQLVVGPRGHAGRRVGEDPAVPADDRPGRQLQLAPPGDVVEVAEGADHRDARALVRLGEAVRHDRHLDVEQRRPHGLAEQRLVPLVVGVGDQRDAGGQQLGPGGLDVDRALAAGEPDPVVGAGALPVLELGLGHRRPEGDVPEGRRLLGVGLTAGEVVQEHPLRGGAGGLRDRPVDVRTSPPTGPTRRQSCSKARLVLLGQLHAQLDEVAPGDRHAGPCPASPAG